MINECVPCSFVDGSCVSEELCNFAGKVIIEKSRDEVSQLGQPTIENVSQPIKIVTSL